MRTDYQIDWDTHLIRCSSLGNITTLGRGAILTDNQRKELDDLLAKVQLTEKQAIRRDELIAKRDAPPTLSEGAKTYLKQVFIEVVLGRRKHIDTKYIRKGHQNEHLGIELANRVLKWGLSQDYIDGLDFNKERLNNLYVTGEMDLNTSDILADIKSSWDVHTFPFFESEPPNKDYIWQMQGYMMLTGHTEAQLVYVLTDTPEQLILDEMRRREWQMGVIELPEDVEAEIRKSMTFGDIPEEYRVKRYTIKYDPSMCARIVESVKLAREYLLELTEEYTNNAINNKLSITQIV